MQNSANISVSWQNGGDALRLARHPRVEYRELRSFSLTCYMYTEVITVIAIHYSNFSLYRHHDAPGETSICRGG